MTISYHSNKSLFDTFKLQPISKVNIDRILTDRVFSASVEYIFFKSNVDLHREFPMIVKNTVKVKNFTCVFGIV